MSERPINITAEPTSRLVRSGEWLAIHGYVTQDDLPMSLAEVWLLINGRHVKCIPQTCWQERFWFSCRFGPGRYFIQAEAYKVMEETTTQTEKGLVKVKKEHKLKSESIMVTAIPKLFNANRMLPRSYEIENWRKITLAEGITLAKKAKKPILKRYRDTSKVYLVGGVVKRGWSRRDIDLLVVSPSLYEECKIKGELVPSSDKTGVIKTHIKELRALSFEKEVENYISYPTSVFVMKEKPDKIDGGFEI